MASTWRLCTISGRIDESMDTEQMSQPAQEWEFRSKPAWQRLIIMLGGVTVNLILGFLIYMMILFVWGKNTLYTEELPLGMSPSAVAEEAGFEVGDQIINVDGKTLDNVFEINKLLFLRDVEQVTVKRRNGTQTTLDIPEGMGEKMFESGELMPLSPTTSTVLDSVISNSPADLVGLQPGDRLISLNDQNIEYWNDLGAIIKGKGKQEITLIIERERSRQTLQFSTDEEGTIGVYPKYPVVNFNNEKLSLGESIVEGFDYGYWTLYDYVSQFQYIFTKKGASQLGGFGAIGNMFPDTWDWKGFWASTALISIILAFMNILPIPALDGGHVMFLVYEIVTGRKPNDKFMEYAQMFGFFLLMALVLFANGNDLYRLIFN